MTGIADVDALDRLRRRIESTTNAALSAAGVDSHLVRCEVAGEAGSVTVNLCLPVAIPRHVERALQVRVMDAVHSTGCTYGDVDVRITNLAGPRRSAESLALPVRRDR